MLESSLDIPIEPSLEIIKPGVMALLQDYGRYGIQHYGITNSGPMDEHAYLWANKILGNHFDAPQIEICMGGFEARFNKPTVIAICGANLLPTLNRTPIKTWQTHRVKEGDVIRFSGAKNGMYAYLAISGGFKVEPQLNSCSTVTREQLGGLHKNGDKLESGDSLPYQAKNSVQDNKREGNIAPHVVIVPEECVPRYEDSINLRFVPNYSENGCDQSTIDAFIQQSINTGYRVSNDLSRMGYRLQGETALTNSDNNIISQGISTGFIQLPKDGQPIVLMKDRQTIGGYPLLGCVAHLDLASLSQSKPGVKVRFTPVEVDELEEELGEYFGFLLF